MPEVKELIEKLLDKVQKDDSIKELFTKDPVKAVEKVLGVDLPDELIEKIVDGVKAKIKLEDLGDIAGKLGGLFKK